MLNEYSKKRDFKKTPEPRPAARRSASGGLRFVIQKHAARRLHYDFRLEAGGVLLSWAVPKGPSLDPSDKRLAVRTEDHPFDYKDFEGIIPRGQYGAGEVIIWDEGTYIPEDGDGRPKKELEKLVTDGIEKGKLSFKLEGKKLKGSWALVRLKTKKSDDDWLLLKHDDEYAATLRAVTELDHSVVSDRSIESLSSDPDSQINEGTLADHLTGSRKARFPKSVSPMLAGLVDRPFTRQGWIYEPKLDGIRAVSFILNGQATLKSRGGLDLTDRYPSIAAQLSLNDKMVLDGEIVALDENSRPSFQLLQQRSGLSRRSDVDKAEQHIPVVYYVFDILYYGERDLMNAPLSQRKELLAKVLPPRKNVRLVVDLDCSGEEAFSICLKNGLEGIVAKSLDSRYEPGRRSKAWLKVKGTESAEFVICGYTKGTGVRSKTFGSLVLGYIENKKLHYAGNVGTGFDQKLMDRLLSMMKSLHSSKNPFAGEVKGKAEIKWLTPSLVAEIKYAEWTKDRILRSPVFMRLREDIEPAQTGPQEMIEAGDVEPSGMPKKLSAAGHTGKTAGKRNQGAKLSKADGKGKKTPAPVRDESVDLALIDDLVERLDNEKNSLTLKIDEHKISLTNLNKELWPGEKHAITKRGYLSYLLKMASHLLPHLKDRLITLVRFPNGISGQRFYQKHWERNRPPFVETVNYYSEANAADQEYLMCNNLATLVWLAQIADLELHTAHSRVNPEPDALWLPDTFTGSVEKIESSLLNYPDFIVFDLDPYLYSGKEKKGEEPELHRKGFAKAGEIALALKDIFDTLNIKSYVKTSGKTGLHIYVPIVRNIDYDTVRNLAESFGRYIMKERPDDVTMEWSVKKRTGKVFFDHNMNARNKTLASIYSPRNHPFAPVSVPLRWDEVKTTYPLDFTVETVPDRLKEAGDLWEDILLHKNDLLSLTK